MGLREDIGRGIGQFDQQAQTESGCLGDVEEVDRRRSELELDTVCNFREAAQLPGSLCCESDHSVKKQLGDRARAVYTIEAPDVWSWKAIAFRCSSNGLHLLFFWPRLTLHRCSFARFS